ncbi:hypothetical protein OG978_44555 (plasmid) [Streptomyces sp. NBC_01591]|uniref:hypothetical protein n=1 Tax=Streptomyces sp. NBC_01591 TaxID=2975888 RepID=UPI002DDC7AA8|nr:hypothetical protein [Streptomyces sp. NBC_01591]WSD74681.1 hypothetical protein OG978_44555 [Streptomyces sp. NBC_01591]
MRHEPYKWHLLPRSLCSVYGNLRRGTQLDESGRRLLSRRVANDEPELLELLTENPVCNKVVLLLLGASGALSYWAPLQPLVALASAALLAEAALRRLSAQVACPVPASV